MKTTVLMLLTTVMTLVIVHANPLSQTEKTQILRLHNQARREVTDASDMIELAWDFELERAAQQYTDTCPSAFARLTDQGQNIALGWPSRSVSDTVNGWVDEKRQFFNYDLEQWCDGGLSKCGSYSQIIWAMTSRIGCARRSGCSNLFGYSGPGDIYVCRYKGPGNIVGMRPYSRGIPCSRCKGRNAQCNNGLCLSPPDDPLLMAQWEKDDMLMLHNKARREVGASDMVLLVWDHGLERDAQRYADTCPSGHSQRSGQGENLAWGWPYRSVNSTMIGWVDEERPFFNYSLDQWCSGGLSKCGHYVQIIWSTTNRIGCARRSGCRNMLGNQVVGDVYVCRYKGPGNIVGMRPYSRGIPCSRCKGSNAQCNNGLCLSPPGDPLLMAQWEKDEMLMLHNKARREVTDASDMAELVWDYGLERDAQQYADTCPSGHARQSGQGENLAWGWPDRSVADSMNGWVEKELPFFRYNLERWCLGGISTCGHYVQIIWAKTTRVGCARRSRCNNMLGKPNPGDVYVCRYREQGNYIGQRPYNRGAKCSACPSSCRLGLCSTFSSPTTGFNRSLFNGYSGLQNSIFKQTVVSYLPTTTVSSPSTIDENAEFLRQHTTTAPGLFVSHSNNHADSTTHKYRPSATDVIASSNRLENTFSHIFYTNVLVLTLCYVY